ncbi:DUF2171 domain-containing protein [Natrinema salifodinae]|uniref:Sporulation protein YlmC, PRC-barrel domain family n=1 Tax=Natrinema salifodinae TaxID=1202768 RepID=A0A1I0MIC4_9EURY|nr:DUF2171 domain-containing protein [Natrinema salifodinae]SEV88085.1 hypothetical protein SAMN05216285_1007 [Natrinema salifodinae]
MTVELTEDLLGKSVTTDNGQEIGTVAEIDEDNIYIDMMSDGDSEHDRDIAADEIKEITDDEVIISEPEVR